MIPDRLQNCWDDFWNDQTSTKYGPSDPVFITKILQQIKNNGSVLGHIIFIFANLVFGEIRNVIVSNCSTCWNFIFLIWKFEISISESLSVDIVGNLKLGILWIDNWNFDNVNFVFLELDSWQSWSLKRDIWELWKTSVTNWQMNFGTLKFKNSKNGNLEIWDFETLPHSHIAI